MPCISAVAKLYVACVVLVELQQPLANVLCVDCRSRADLSDVLELGLNAVLMFVVVYYH